MWMNEWEAACISFTLPSTTRLVDESFDFAFGIAGFVYNIDTYMSIVNYIILFFVLLRKKKLHSY